MEFRTEDGVVIVNVDYDQAIRDVAEAAKSFVSACYVYGDDGQFQILTHHAPEEGRVLWDAVGVLKTIEKLREEAGLT